MIPYGNWDLKFEPHSGHINQDVVEQLPDMIGGVDLFHFDLGVYITVIDKVHISSVG